MKTTQENEVLEQDGVKKNTKKIVVTLSNTQNEHLKIMSEFFGSTRTAIIREAISKAFTHYLKNKKAYEKYERQKFI